MADSKQEPEQRSLFRRPVARRSVLAALGAGILASLTGAKGSGNGSNGTLGTKKVEVGATIEVIDGKIVGRGYTTDTGEKPPPGFLDAVLRRRVPGAGQRTEGEVVDTARATSTSGNTYGVSVSSPLKPADYSLRVEYRVLNQATHEYELAANPVTRTFQFPKNY